MKRIDEVKFPESNAELFEGFVKAKRAHGYIYGGGHLGVARRLAEFMDERGDGPTLTEEAVTEWCRRREGESVGTQRIRACMVRQLGLHMSSLGMPCYILPALMIPKNTDRFDPFVFSAEQIQAVADVLDGEAPDLANPNTHAMYPLLFRMLYGCGLRISEALELKGEDVNVASGTIDVIEGKGGSRRVPMSKSLTAHCVRYFDAMGPSVEGDNPLFPGGGAEGHLTRVSARTHLIKAFASAGVFDSEGKPPRVHDLRHTFICHAIQKANDDGIDPNAVLPALAVMVGHKNIKMTERYIHLTDVARAEVIDKMSGSGDITLQGGPR